MLRIEMGICRRKFIKKRKKTRFRPRKKRGNTLLTKKNSIQEKKKKARNQVFDQAIEQEKKALRSYFFLS